LLSLLVVLGACRSTPKPAKCEANKGAYLTAIEHAPLTTPTGLETPDRRTALTVPPGNGKSIDKQACLQRAPSYFGTAGRIAASPEETVADWAQAWADRNSTAVLAMYSSKFVTDAPAGAEAWLAQRAIEVNEGPLPNGRVLDLKIIQQGSERRLAAFVQRFGNNGVHKELKLLRDAGVWKISSEQVMAADSLPAKK
jgi:hypothetical protein